MTPVRSSRYTLAIAALTLVGVGTTVYLSPVGSSARKVVSDAPTSSSSTSSTSSTATSRSTSRSAGPSSSSAASSSAAAPAGATGDPGDGDSTGDGTGDDTGNAAAGGTTLDPPAPAPAEQDLGGGSSTVRKVTVTPVLPRPTAPAAGSTDGLQHCWDFTWQQDAQTAYVANLSDPAGLDGAAGPYNGDGLACTLLPVDPSRAASSPLGVYVPPKPSAPTKQQLVSPAKKYYGLTIEGVPFTTKPLDVVNSEIGKTPALLQWFTNWNQTPSATAAGYSGAYRADAVKTAWSRGALPVITWQSMDSGFVPQPGKSRTDQTAYSLATILSGAYDDYIRQFAIDVVKTDLPVGIRFDQEMNGDFYPWNQRAGLNGKSRGTEFAQMWQHVWTIFDSVGANADVIWIWAPNRVDSLGEGQDTQTAFDRFYPGDQYVDWLGLDAYWRYPTKPTDYATTFATTLNLLKHAAPVSSKGVADKSAVNTKPIFLAETGALGTSHDSPPVDLTPQKVTWLNNMFAGIKADPQVVGFAYFDNDAQQQSGSTVITNDWRIDDNPTVLSAFKDAVNDPAFASGLALDGNGVQP